MRSTFRTFMFVLGLSTVLPLTPALADDTQEAIRGLTELSILMDKSTMAYDMFRLDEGNPIYSSALNRIVERIRTNTQTYQGQFGNDADISNNIQQLNRSLDTFLKELKTNQDEIAQGGYEEFALVDDMYDQKASAKNRAAELIDAIKSTTGTTADPVVVESRELAALLQTITANYIEQASSITGRALRGGEDQNLAIDKLSDLFSERLAAFNPASDKVIGLNAKVRDVKNKWAFLKNSMANFKTDTVPYLVFHYADKMVDDLLDIADMYENKDRQAIQAPSFGMEDNGSTPLPFGIPPAQN